MDKIKEEIIASFNANAPGSGNGIFGLPFDKDTADLIIIPVPWEVTVSYRAGTADGPNAILEASRQVDLYIQGIPDAWKMGIHMLPIDENIKKENNKYRDLAARYISFLEENGEEAMNEELKIIPNAVSEMSEKLNIYVRSQANRLLNQGKMVALVGGDHSTPLGLINAIADYYSDVAILQIDAHADLRESYENFTYSHASIMYNALNNNKISKLVQVGIRDLCEEEANYIKDANPRVITYYDEDIKFNEFKGINWQQQCEEIVSKLPQNVYISLDIDGLDPKLCPNTGTPVPGGLSFHQVIYLIQEVVKSGKRIVAFDINEVAPGEDEWDAIVGARLLYQLSALMGVSQHKLKLVI